MPSETLTAIPASPPKAGALTFALLFTLESLVRSLNAGVMSVQAYDLLHSSRNVSILSFMASASVLLTTLSLPYALRRMRRRWAYTLGIVISALAALSLATHTVPGQAAGQYLRSTGAAVMAVTMSLYILDHIHKSDYARAEPLRLAFSTIAWSVGPAAGLWLYTHHGIVTTQSAVVGAALLLALVFWIIRLTDPITLPSGTLQPFHPVKNIRRFAAQPRLRLAWSIALCRSAFWSALFIYGPILLIEGGLSKTQGGYLISASQMMLPLALVFGWIARRVGVRAVIGSCFAVMAVAALAAGLVGTHAPVVTIVLLLFGAAAATGLDGIGGIPYMRAVKPRERREMTSVYRTFIECSELGPGIVFALVLSFLPTASVYVIVSLIAAGMSFLAWRHLPKSL
ncbi:MAG: MFS transporter [Hyphomicrobiales bacterium]